MKALQDALDARRVRLQSSADGVEAELVVVFETVGTIEGFLRALQQIPGLEWLAELAQPEIPADEDFHFTEPEDAEASLSGAVYLVLENAQGMQQLLNLWQGYQRNPDAKFAWGLAPIKHMFRQLRDLRRWGPADRVRETGIEQNWREQLSMGNEAVRFEAELWFRDRVADRTRSAARFLATLQAAGGRAVSASEVPEIRYHGILAELPPAPLSEVLAHFNDLVRLPETNFIRAEEVMFFRPLPQWSALTAPPDDEEPPIAGVGVPDGAAPIVALFDGLPFSNHQRLAGRLIVDDPDGWEQNYLAQHRRHGTAMASLIVHGDLNDGEAPLVRPLYVRPLLRPVERHGQTYEEVPADQLPVDLTYRAFKRMFVGEAGVPPTAPTVRIVNFSIGDLSRPFLHELSPWAKLFDWAAAAYNVLINVSCGNYADLSVRSGMKEFGDLSPAERSRLVFGFCHDQSRHRRLLSPSEAVNSLCVGATHEDSSTAGALGYRLDVCPEGHPSPLNAIGSGYLRSIKPEILLPGGKQLFTTYTKDGLLHLVAPGQPCPPGQLVAMPATAGSLTGVGHVRGSSNATALASRAAARAYEMLEELRITSDLKPGEIPRTATAALLKTLLVHGATWPASWRSLGHLLGINYTEQDLRKLLMRYGGYGRLDLSRVLECTPQRATMLGAGVLEPDQGHVFRVPVPRCLNAAVVWRRLTVTLAWIAPLNFRHRRYRATTLWFDPPTGDLHLKRTAADASAVRRGTVQHECLEGRDAVALADDAFFNVKVNCRADAGGPGSLATTYAIAITLEASEKSTLPIYEQVKARIRPTVPVRV